MIDGIDSVWQALLGTLFTWFVTGLGAAVVLIAPFIRNTQKLLEASLGFASGVMLAASYWSLLKPAIEIAEDSGAYGRWVFAPVSVGFLLGAYFVFFADKMLIWMGVSAGQMPLDLMKEVSQKVHLSSSEPPPSTSIAPSSPSRTGNVLIDVASEADELAAGAKDENSDGGTALRRRPTAQGTLNSLHTSLATTPGGSTHPGALQMDSALRRRGAERWRRILLLVIAITVHNIPEGLAVGVGFGAVGQSPKATFASARNLAIGIAIQNFPEGLAVALPLRTSGCSIGVVEPVAGLLGAAAVGLVTPLLPYALAFAAGAMVYVVLDDLVPEMYQIGVRPGSPSGSGSTKAGLLGCWSAMFGFVVMMSLDVAAG